MAKVIGAALPGLIASTFLGWPGIFYICGSSAMLWAFIMMFTLIDSPMIHPSISEKEKSLYSKNVKINILVNRVSKGKKNFLS